jgi:hypothetical protein
MKPLPLVLSVRVNKQVVQITFGNLKRIINVPYLYETPDYNLIAVPHRALRI